MKEKKSWLYLIWSRCVNNSRVVWNFGEESTRKHRIPSRFQTMTMLTSEMEIWMINEDMNYVWLEKSSTEEERKSFFWRAGSRKEKKTSWSFQKIVLMNFKRWMDRAMLCVCCNWTTYKFRKESAFGWHRVWCLNNHIPSIQSLFMKLIRQQHGFPVRSCWLLWVAVNKFNGGLPIEHSCFDPTGAARKYSVYLVDLPRPPHVRECLPKLIFDWCCCVPFSHQLSSRWSVILCICVCSRFIHISLY